MNEAVRCYVWSQLRGTWRRRVPLVVLLGAVGAASIAAAAGAARTSSAVDRFLEEHRAFDVAVSCGVLEPAATDHPCEAELQQVAAIEDTASLVTLPGLLTVDGRNLEPTEDTCWSGPGDVSLVVAPDGRFGTVVNTHRFIEGRPADPARSNEVVVSRELARRTGLGPGDQLDVSFFAGEDCLGDPTTWQLPRSFDVVGVEVSPFEVRPESGYYASYVHGTPALLREVADLPDRALSVATRLRPGRSVEDIRPNLEAMGVSFEVDGVEERQVAVPQSLNAENLRRSTRPSAIAQWLVSAVIALSGLVLVGQVLARQIRTAAADHEVLRQLGLTDGDLRTVGAAHAGSVIIPAAALAVVGAVLASPLTPLGVARVIDPDPGLRLDPVVVLLGGIVVIVGLACAVLGAVLVSARSRRAPGVTRSGRASALARRAGGGPVSTTGLHLAFDPLRGPAAPPLRTGFSVILAAVVMLVGATVFGGSLTHLLRSKHLVGWNWDAFVYVETSDGDASGPTNADLYAALLGTPGVVEATPGTFFSFVELGPERTAVQAISFAGGPIGPTMISGRPPRGADEIVLGRETLSRLGASVGDELSFRGAAGDPDRGNGSQVSGVVTIVGTAVLPGGGGDSRLGNGSAAAFELFRAGNPDFEPDVAFVRLEPGTELDQVVATVGDVLDVDGVGALTEDFVGGQLLDLGQVAGLPIVLAGMLAVLTVGVVAQVIVSSTHARRGELGVLRALGFRPRQIRGAIAVQAVSLGGATLLVGIPLGIAVGREAWRRFALSLGTKPEISVATAWLVGLIAALLLLATVLAVVGSVGSRRQLSAALRRE